jgi:hypothetical protein
VESYPGPTISATDNVYPGPAYVTPLNALSTPSDLTADHLEIPQPKPDLGVVRGQFVAKNAVARAMISGDYYLAPVIYTQGKVEIPFVSLDIQKDPKATLRNLNYEFAFVDVPPGEYGIIVHTPVSDYVIPDGAGGFRLIKVETGKVIDLGVIELE